MTLPLSSSAPAAAPAQDAVPTAPEGDERLRVLVVDDNVDGAAMLAELLELWGHGARVAHTGAAALSLAAATPLDVVLLDFGLPELDGYEVARRLRAAPGGERLTLVALTGYGTADDVARARAAGFDRHFTKPLAVEPLEAFLDETRARRRSRGP